eukprot:6040927-Pyramimonas_sp.AAC.1
MAPEAQGANVEGAHVIPEADPRMRPIFFLAHTIGHLITPPLGELKPTVVSDLFRVSGSNARATKYCL